MKWLPGLVVAALVLAGIPASAAPETSEQYLDIFNLVQQADSLNNNGKTNQALAKYKRAAADLQDFQKVHYDWSIKAVSYRLTYLGERIARLSGQPGTPAGAAAVGGLQLPTAAAPASAAPAAADAGTQVKLLAAGAEPRKVLRLHPVAGDKQSLAMTLKMSMDVQVAGVSGQNMKMPAMETPMELTVKDVSPAGDISYETVMGEASVADEPGTMPQLADAMKSALGGFKGLTGSGILSNRGLSKETKFELPSDAPAQTRQMIDQMKESFSEFATPLPEEAVGAGAKWEARRTRKAQGMKLAETVTYELVGIDDDRITAKASIVQTAANQKIESPAMPGMKMDLIKMASTGTSDFALDLAHIMPGTAEATSHIDLSMGMKMGAQTQVMSMTMDLKVGLAAK